MEKPIFIWIMPLLLLVTMHDFKTDTIVIATSTVASSTMRNSSDENATLSTPFTSPEVSTKPNASETRGKECYRPKQTQQTATAAYQGKCSRQTKTCSYAWRWPIRRCEIKTRYYPCTKYREELRPKYITEPACCPGFLPINDSDVCVQVCPNGTYGSECSLKCNCPLNAEPDCAFTGECICEKGWIGPNCTRACPEGTYGYKCESICLCENNSTCDPVNGTCNCTVPGWTGETCGEVCANGTFGYACSQNCYCNANQTCDPFTGMCSCKAGVTGPNCTEECEDGYYGENCENICQCRVNSTLRCDPYDGTCTCARGWMDSNCGSVCSDGYFGDKCEENCTCTDEEFCHPISGNCFPRCWCSLNSTANCDSSFDTCNCKDVRRNVSLSPEEAELFGPIVHPISLLCVKDDENIQLCVPENNTLECICRAGWTGHACEKRCSKNYYGPMCQNKCRCAETNTLNCDVVTGTCECSPGWRGVECRAECPAGRYGLQCKGQCNCTELETCHHITSYCTPVTNDKQTRKENENTPRLGLLLGILIPAVIIAGLCLFCFIMYRRKGGRAFRQIQFTMRKNRNSSEATTNNRTIEMHPQPESASLMKDIASGSRENNDVSQRKGKNGDSAGAYDTFNGSGHRKSTTPNQNGDDVYDSSQQANNKTKNDDMYSGQIVDDGIYNELRNKNSRLVNISNEYDGEYSHLKPGASGMKEDEYDVFQKGKNDNSLNDEMYTSVVHSENTYDVTRVKTNQGVLGVSDYDTAESLASTPLP